MEIRKTNDYKLIAKLNQPVQDLHYDLYPEFFKPYIEADVIEYFSSIINEEGHSFLVCYEEDKPLGFIWYEDIRKPETPFNKQGDKLYVHMMSVNNDARGKGVGRLLLEEAARSARVKSINRIELDYWCDNDGARQFYEKLGFVVRKETAYMGV